MIESVFLAYRNAKYVVVKNTIFSLVKVVLPLALVGFGAFGVFAMLTSFYILDIMNF